MKKNALIFLSLTLLFTACQKSTPTVQPAVNKNVTQNSIVRPSSGGTGNAGEFISVSLADSMIGSYLTSISSSSNDTDLRSFSIDANLLRAYLSDGSVSSVKLVFAHSSDYMASHYGEYSGMKAGGLTIVIVGYDTSGNYVYRGGMVLDHAAPCPYTCPSGSASSYLLP